MSNPHGSDISRGCRAMPGAAESPVRGRTAVRLRWALCATILLASALVGCGANDSADGSPAPNRGDEALYAISSNTYNADIITGFVALANSLDASVSLDYSQALEIGGGGAIYGVPGTGTFFTSSGESPTLTRFTVDSDNRFTEGPTISFANLGFTYSWVAAGQVTFLAEDKAYLFFPDTATLVVWNPSAMTVDGAIDLQSLLRPGWELRPATTSRVRDGEVFIGTGWGTFGADQATYPGVALAVVDSASDEVLSVTEDERCGDITASTVASDGTLYFACTNVSALNHFIVPDSAPEPCLLRVNPGERRFDPDFYVPLADAIGSRVAGGLVQGPGDLVYVKAVDESLIDLDTVEAVRDIFPKAVWRWWALDLETREATMVTNLAPGAGSINTVEVDDSVLTVVEEEDFSETTLVAMTSPGAPTPAVRVLGASPSVVRLR